MTEPSGFIQQFSAALLAEEDAADANSVHLHDELRAVLVDRRSLVLDVRFTGFIPIGAPAPGAVDPGTIKAAAALIIRRVTRVGFTADASPADLAALIRAVTGEAAPTVALMSTRPSGIYLTSAEGTYRPERPGVPGGGAVLPAGPGGSEAEEVELSAFELLDTPPEAAGSVPSTPTDFTAGEGAHTPGGGMYDFFRTADAAPQGEADALAERLGTATGLTEFDRLCQSAAPAIVRLLDEGSSAEAVALIVALARQIERPDRSRVFRDSAAQALRRAANPRSAYQWAGVLPTLPAAQRGPFARVVLLLGEEARSALAGALGQSPDPELRSEIFSAIAEAPDGNDWLLDRFRSEGGAVRATALLQAAVSTDANHARWLTDGLRHPEAAVRMEAARLAGEERDGRVVRPLVDALSGLDPDVRKAAARALGRAGGAAAIPFLSRAAGADPEEAVQLEAITALGETGAPEAILPLLESARKRSLLGGARAARLRLAAVSAISVIPHPRAREGLRELTKERDEHVSAAAARLLEKQGG